MSFLVQKGMSLKHIPIAGRDISQFNVLRERGEMTVVPPEDQLKVAKRITVMCQDIIKELHKYDADPYQYFQRLEGEHSVTGRLSRRRDQGLTAYRNTALILALTQLLSSQSYCH